MVAPQSSMVTPQPDTSARARTKAAKRRNRRALNAAMRAQALKLKVPRKVGLVKAAELAVEDDAREREKRDEPKLRAKRVNGAWPCDTYLRRREISQEQHSAAQRIHEAWMHSGLNPWASRPDAGVPSGDPATPGCGPTYAAYLKAVRAVGIQLFPVIADVVLVGKHAGEWARSRNLKDSDGIACLRLSLDVLAAHYRGER